MEDSVINQLVQLILQHPWRVALGGLLPILAHLVIKKHAVFHPVDPGSGDAGCLDKDVTKDILTLGGASAYTFGIQYFALAYFTAGGISNLFTVYGQMQFALSAIQVLTYLVQVPKSNKSNILLKSHLQGCGYTTAWSPLWLLYWLQKLPLMGWLVYVRDALTIIDFVFSLPATLIMRAVTKRLFGKWTTPIWANVDHPRTH